jgi:hypothetical protein
MSSSSFVKSVYLLNFNCYIFISRYYSSLTCFMFPGFLVSVDSYMNLQVLI